MHAKDFEEGLGDKIVSLQTDVTLEYLRKALEFAVKYYLNPYKVLRKRSSQQERHLGEIVDDFISGKIIELGVMDILKQINPKKTCVPDFDIHDDADFGDPDIVAVIDGDPPKNRPPKTFVEIKNNDKDDQWTGLYTTQWNSINEHDLVNDGDNLYIVYASIKAKGDTEKIYDDDEVQSRYSKRTKDVFGILLSNLLAGTPVFKKFISSNQLYVGIDRVLTGKELREHGRFFNAKIDAFTDEQGVPHDEVPADSFWAIGGEQLFEITDRDFINADGSLRKNMEPVQPQGNILPLDPSAVPRQFGDFEFSGEISDVFRATVGKRPLYFTCTTDVIVKNDFIGEYSLTEDNQYKMTFNKTGGGDCKSNNLYIAKRNFHNIARPAEERMKEIVEKI